MVRVLALFLAGFLALPALAQDKGYSALVAKAKKVIVRDLKDPESARFRDLGIYKSTTGKGGVTVCGEINAKNAYGAYVGYRRFYVYEDMGYVDAPDEGGGYLPAGPWLCHELVQRIK